ncbi:unnamed protein product [Rotaria sp. Silwood1]|nr:unnamed protein product [Rotaria sp. Silwood1]
MGIFTRLYFLRKPLIFCAATGLLWTKLNNNNDIDKEKLQLIINQADLICQEFKEKQGIPGNINIYTGSERILFKGG